MFTSKILIMNLEHELLAHLFYDNDLYLVNSDIIKDELFQDQQSKSIFIIFRKLLTSNREPDILTISEMLKNKYPNIMDILMDMHSINTLNSNPFNIIDLLRKKYQINELVLLGKTLNGVSENDKIEDITNIISEKLHQIQTTGKKQKIQEFENVVADLIHHINSQKDDEITGIATGMTEYDKFTKGLHMQDLVVVAGETSQGKTSFAISMIYKPVLNNNAVLFISLEMSQMQLAARFLSQHTNVSSKEMLYHSMNEKEKAKIITEIEPTKDFPLYIDDSSGSNYLNICSLIRKYKVQKNIKIVVVDYLQLVNYHRSGINKEQEIGDIARGFKNLAKELDINIILLSQLSRDKNNPKPSISRLRQSGQIEEASDQVILVFRPEFYFSNFEYRGEQIDIDGIGIVDLAKGRSVGITDFIMKFNKDLTMWHDYDKNIKYEQARDDNYPF